MKILTLLQIPISVFIALAFSRWIFNKLSPSRNWWTMPLCITSILTAMGVVGLISAVIIANFEL